MPGAELQAILTCNNQQFIQAMNQAIRKMQDTKKTTEQEGKKIDSAFSKIGGGLAGALSIGAIGAGLSKIIDFAGEIQDTADKLNLSTTAVQGFNGAFAQSGATAEVVSKGFIKLNENIDAAREGSNDAIKRFAALGVSMDDIRNHSPEQIMYQIAEAVKNTKDPVRTLASVMELLGKSGSKMLPGLKAGAEGLKQMVDEVKKLTPKDVKTLDDLGDVMTRLGTRAEVWGASAILGYRDALEGLYNVYAKGRRMFGNEPEFGPAKGMDKRADDFRARMVAEEKAAEAARAKSVFSKSGRGRGYAQPDMYESEMATLGIEASAREKNEKELADKMEKDAKELADFQDKHLQHQQDMQEAIRKINEETAAIEEDSSRIGLNSQQLIAALTKDRAKWLAIIALKEQSILDIDHKRAALARQLVAEIDRKIKQEEAGTIGGFKAWGEGELWKDRKLNTTPQGAFSMRGASNIQTDFAKALRGGMIGGGIGASGLGSTDPKSLYGKGLGGSSDPLSKAGLGLSTNFTGNAHSLVRSGDKARAKAQAAEEAKTKKDRLVYDPNTAELVRIWGGQKQSVTQ